MEEENREKIEQIQMQIIEMQGKLGSDSSEIGDWKVIKIYEARLKGETDPYDAAALMNERQKIRDEINNMQEQLAELKKENEST